MGSIWAKRGCAVGAVLVDGTRRTVAADAKNTLVNDEG